MKGSVKIIFRSIFFLIIYLCLTVLGFTASGFTEKPSKSYQGVTETEIVFGQSAALTGSAKELGLNMRDGILAAFKEVNSKGGVYGRRLKLLSRDDRYEPELAIKNIHSLIKKEKVFSFVGGVGTPTSKAVLPIVSKSKMLYIGPFTGASFLRTSYLETVVNVRSSYFQEIREMILHLRNDVGVKRIGILYQNDSFGLDGLHGLERAVKEIGKGVQIVSQGNYVRNTKAVKAALLGIRKNIPEAIIIIGTYAPAATFIKWAEKLKMKSTFFLSVSFVGVSALARELKDSKSNVFVTQVVPFPYQEKGYLIPNYRRAIKKIKGSNKVGFVTLEGYIVGRLVIKALKRAGKKLTRESFARAFKSEKSQFSINGFNLSYTRSDNQGSNRVFLTRIYGGKVLSLKNLKSFRNTRDGNSERR